MGNDNLVPMVINVHELKASARGTLFSQLRTQVLRGKSRNSKKCCKHEITSQKNKVVLLTAFEISKKSK
jgi:hypothetical protein